MPTTEQLFEMFKGHREAMSHLEEWEPIDPLNVPATRQIAVFFNGSTPGRNEVFSDNIFEVDQYIFRQLRRKNPDFFRKTRIDSENRSAMFIQGGPGFQMYVIQKKATEEIPFDGVFGVISWDEAAYGLKWTTEYEGLCTLVDAGFCVSDVSRYFS